MPLAKAASNSEAIMRDNNNRRRDDRNNQPESDIKDRLVTINRSTKTTKGGRTFTFTGIVVVGDEKGKVGHGSGRSREVVTAIQKGIEDAKKNMVEVPVINGTVPHAQEAVFAGARVLGEASHSRYGCDRWRRHARCIWRVLASRTFWPSLWVLRTRRMW